jgi:hypothetical protein
VRLGIAAHRATVAGVLLAVAVLVLAITDAVMDRAAMPGWLLALYAVPGVLAAVWPWAWKHCWWCGFWARCSRAPTAPQARAG